MSCYIYLISGFMLGIATSGPGHVHLGLGILGIDFEWGENA